jgi:putative Holliday junction resolvase
MKFLGIDYGAKRIGLAISDENGQIAFPREIIPNDKKALIAIGELIQEESIADVVVGKSMDFSGAPNSISKDIESFGGELASQYGVKIHKQQEFLTSVEARKAGKTKASFQKSGAHSKMKKVKDKKADASAAALILQRFLDRNNKIIW